MRISARDLETCSQLGLYPASQEKSSSGALSLGVLASSLMQKHSQDSNQASLTLAVLEIKGLRPRKGAPLPCSAQTEMHVVIRMRVRVGVGVGVGVRVRARVRVMVRIRVRTSVRFTNSSNPAHFL